MCFYYCFSECIYIVPQVDSGGVFFYSSVHSCTSVSDGDDVRHIVFQLTVSASQEVFHNNNHLSYRKKTGGKSPAARGFLSSFSYISL